MHSPTAHAYIPKQMMEFLDTKTKLFASFLLCFSFFSLLSLPSHATTPAGTIQRTTKQQILATIPPDTEDTPQPFITSPSGKYVAYFVRHKTAPGAGGFGNDFCYVQVQDTSTDQSVWESECAPVSDTNACTLVFDDAGLDVFDGSQSVWDAGADGYYPDTLQLVDEGDMRVVDKEGELAWKASDDPRANQGCGLPGSPGLAPAVPPFAAPIGSGSNLPFGQQPGQGNQPQPQPQPGAVGFQQQQQQPQPGAVGFQQQQQQQQPQPNEAGFDQQQPSDNGVNQPSVVGSQPLVDNNPFDSGSCRGVVSWFGLAILALLAWFVCGFLF